MLRPDGMVSAASSSSSSSAMNIAFHNSAVPRLNTLHQAEAKAILYARGGAEEAEEKDEAGDEEISEENSKKDNNAAQDGEASSASIVAQAISQVESSDDEGASKAKVATESSTLRLKGKELHDEGNFEEAAEVFGQAADALLESLSEESDEDTSIEYSTCRLHQALCYLKVEQYDDCIDACTQVLDDSSEGELPAAVRARAYHRRAKANMGKGDSEAALQDARSAAFLGDRKAVALYGKLMRSDSGAGGLGDGSSLSDLLTGTGAGSGSGLDMGSLFSGLDGPPASGSSGGGSNALLESLLSKSSPSDGSGSSSSGFNPLSLLLNKGSGNNNNNSMAKSVLKSLVKKLDDESTQDTISSYLQKTNKAQLKQYTSMAGLPMTDDQLTKIESLCHGVTPKTVRKVVKRSKVVIYIAQLVRKIFKVLDKYKSIVVALLVIQWTKSAVNRPMPVNKKATKRALKQAMKANRAKAKAAKK